MLQSSPEVVRQRFDELVRLEPKLASLWQLCGAVAPPSPVLEDDDAFDTDAFDHDPIANDRVEAWCAEEYFLREIKPLLLPLVGWYRPEDPTELRDSTAYDAAYTALFHYALPRSCECCRGHE